MSSSPNTHTSVVVQKDEMKAAWKTYRQQLRDLPAKMQAANVHPNMADMMFPVEPGFTDPPRDPDESASDAEKWAPPN